VPDDEGAPDVRPPTPPSPAALQAIRQAVLAGDHQGAIDAAVAAYGLVGGARWDPALPQEGDTDGHTRVVTIGPPAFADRRTGAPRSPGWLASSIAHENVHLRQLLAVHPVDGGDNYARPETLGDQVNELEAYDWELRHADLLGLLPGERAELTARRQGHWAAIARDPFYAGRIGPEPGAPGHDYWIDPADR
jgi:hypothetical protein